MPKLYRFSYRTALLLVCIVFAVLSLIGLFSTVTEEVYAESHKEHILFLPDSIFANVAACLLVVAVCWALSRIRVTKTLLTIFTIVLLVAVTGFGLFWVSSVHATPSGDSLAIVNRAIHMVRGESHVLAETDYFRRFPFQLGYLFYSELLCRVFGESGLYQAMSWANVFWVDGAYLALLFITRELFDDDRTSFFTAVLCLLCWQPVFMTTFLYGFLPGLAFALWGTYFVLRALRRERPGELIPAALLFAVAVLLKKNYFIPLIAACIVILLHCLRMRKARLLYGAGLMVLCALLLPAGVQKSYERRIGTEFGPGTPQSAWLVMGISESGICSGWYNGYTNNVFWENNYDAEQTRRQIAEDLKLELSKFQGRPTYLASFFYYKITSQWNAPEFQSILISASGDHFEPPEPWVENVYTGPVSRFLSTYFDRYTLIVYIGFAAAMLLLRKAYPMRAAGKSTPGDKASGLLLLPVTVLGGFLYHAAFEAKAQYSLIYLPMLLPYAAFALSQIGDVIDGGRRRVKERRTQA